MEIPSVIITAMKKLLADKWPNFDDRERYTLYSREFIPQLHNEQRRLDTLMHGDSTIQITEEECTYSGEVDKETQKPNGKGLATNKEGKTWSGTFYNGLPEGLLTVAWPFMSTIEGEFKAGK